MRMRWWKSIIADGVSKARTMNTLIRMRVVLIRAVGSGAAAGGHRELPHHLHEAVEWVCGEQRVAAGQSEASPDDEGRHPPACGEPIGTVVVVAAARGDPTVAHEGDEVGKVALQGDRLRRCFIFSCMRWFSMLLVEGR